ncbi:MAG: hypothetical protein ACFFAJ_13160 [Candidatus Hodarchaeota archaeon]
MSENTHLNTENHLPVPTIKGYIVILVLLTLIVVTVEFLLFTGGGDPASNFIAFFPSQLLMLGSYLYFIIETIRSIKKIRNGEYINMRE